MSGGLLLALAGCGPDLCAEGYALTAEGCAPVAVDRGDSAEGGDSAAGGDSETAGDSEGGEDSEAPGDTAEVVLEEAPAPVTPLEAPRLLRRVSLDLRGLLPSEAALDAVEADPAALEGYIDDYLADPATERRLVDLFGERWLTQVDRFQVELLDYPQLADDPENEFAWERSTGEEPLRLLAHIAVADRPWTDIVQVDFTMANETLGAIWPLDYPAGETGWREARYTDGRPAAGVLASSGLWFRYYTTDVNYNRGRAAAIARLLVCEDFLARPVSFSGRDESVDVEDAVNSDPDCLGCHAALDPIAVNLFGFWPSNKDNASETHAYHPAREPLGEYLLQREGAWFGEPTSGLVGLAAAIAEDPRFSECAVETAAGLLWRRPPELEDWDTLLALRQAFVDGGLRFTALLRAVVGTQLYRAGGLTEEADEAAEARELTARMLTPQQLDLALEALTGFHWEWAGYDQLVSDDRGYRLMAGGVDGANTTRAQQVPGLTAAEVHARAAEAAASAAVDRELVEGGERRLFGEISLDDRPGEPAFEAELARLWWRLLAVRPGAAQLTALADLWAAVDEVAGPDQAWIAVTSALLRDPLFLSY